MTTTKNTVTSKFSAVVDGKPTGLAGCATRCTGCLRGHPTLQKAANYKSRPGKCPVYIPV